MKHDEELRKKALERCRHLLEGDRELQAVAPSPEARARLTAPGTGSLRCLSLACALYAERPCLAERAFVVEEGAIRTLPELRTITYAELWARIEALAAGLARGGLVEEGSFVGLCGFAGIDWVVADLACLYLAAVSVPLQTTLTAAELTPILVEAGLSTIVCSLEQLDRVAATLAGAPSVRTLVAMDVHEEDRGEAEALALARQRIEEERGGAALFTLAEVERLGREQGPVAPVEHVDGEALRSIVYTSGSTGSPKGAMFPERVWAQHWQAPWPAHLPVVPYVSVNYMPLNHMAGRLGILHALTAGGRMSFVRASDMSTLFDDIRLARPTSLFLVPRAASMIYQHFQTAVVKRRGGAAEIMASMRRAFLGDRMIYAMTGTAPTAPEVVSFLERCFEIPVIDGYGSTEAGAITVDDRLATDNVIDFRLVDVPELGYLGSDKPWPRGELLVKARRTIPGYYRNPEATAALFDAGGYLRTGDVMEQRGPDELSWIDRKKNVLKLAQGEFVSTSRLEEIFSAGSPFIRQIYIHGSSLRAYLLAVIVPEGTQDKAVLRGEIRRIAAREGLRGYEIPRDFVVEPRPFTRDDGLLTESNKPSRPRLRARYGEALDRLYELIERSQIEELYALELERAEDSSPTEKVTRALAVALGLSETELAQADQSFVQLGGDSLGAGRLATLIQDVCGVALPVGLILDPTTGVRGLVRAVEARLAGSGPPRQATFASVHGAGAETIRVEDLRVDRFLGADDLTAAGKGGEGRPAAEVVALTGANGFLGRFLLLELLDRAARRGGKVVAIVRAPRDSDAAAEERLAASYAGVDPTLPARFAALAQGRLEVISGDLMAPRLGLSEARWEALAGELSAIVHAGALVNHTFSYPQLFEPNVLGTVEVMRLALPRRASIAFVSTVGVASGLDRPAPVREDEDAASLWPRRPIDSGYAVGYSTSKWASEVLLRDFEARTGVSVGVFRCSMIMPPRSFVGQVNAGDFLTRLLHGVVTTSLAPRSFYAPGSKPQFDGLPVDFVAASIAALAEDRAPGYAIWHVVEGQKDARVSLDTLVDWVEQAGYRVQRVDDYARWIAAFREQLTRLRPVDQQRSPLPILRGWERPLRGDPAFDNRRLRARLAELSGRPLEVPVLDPFTIQQYLKNMVYAGLIPHPGISAAA